MVPMPPHSATGMARAEVDTRMDIPPWMIGIFAMNEPILSSGSFIQASWSVITLWKKVKNTPYSRWMSA
jgi:hypothetical protein